MKHVANHLVAILQTSNKKTANTKCHSLSRLKRFTCSIFAVTTVTPSLSFRCITHFLLKQQCSIFSAHIKSPCHIFQASFLPSLQVLRDSQMSLPHWQIFIFTICLGYERQLNVLTQWKRPHFYHTCGLWGTAKRADPICKAPFLAGNHLIRSSDR
jgi:hypothetical protein